MKVTLLIVIFALSTFLGLSRPGEAKPGAPIYILELAPLQGLQGQLSARAEFKWRPAFSAGLGWDRAAWASERSGWKDERLRMSVDGTWQPFASHKTWASGLFGGLGLGVERGVYGRERARDYVTWVRTNADENMDTWAVRTNDLVASPFLGFRMFMDPMLTVSVRANFDQRLTRSQRVTDASIASPGVDTRTPVRPAAATYFGLFAGLAI